MTESTAIAIVLANDKALGEIYQDSGLFPDTKSKAQAIVKIQAGREIGLQPIESMTGLNIFSGKISIGGNAMASKVKGNPKYDYRAIVTDESVSIDFYEFTIDEKGKPIKEKLGNSTFTMQDAKDARLASKDNWVKWKRNMMFNRALSNGVKWYCPDVFGSSSVYTPDELGIDENEDGSPKNITPKATKPTKQPKVVKPKVKQCTGCGGALPNDNESGLCAKCMTKPKVVEAEFKEVKEKYDTEIQGVPEEIAQPILEEMDEADEETEIPGIKPIIVEDDNGDAIGIAGYDDEPSESIKIKGVDKDTKPRDALDKIMQYAMDNDMQDKVKPVIISHYEAYSDGSRYPYHIPEPNVIAIVKELSGMTLKACERMSKCNTDGCKNKLTKPEKEEQQNDDGKPLCLKCYQEYQEG